MRHVAIICAVVALLLAFASCTRWGPQDPVTTPSVTTVADLTVTQETTPEVTTPEKTTPEVTTPAVTDPDFSNDPDPDGTKRY